MLPFLIYLRSSFITSVITYLETKLKSEPFEPPSPALNQGWQNGKMARFWPSRGFILDLGGRTITFWRGGRGKVENFHMQIYFFFIWMRLLLQTIFLCVSPFSCKHFNFSIAFFQCLQPPQTICFKLSHSCQKNNGPSLRTMHPLKLV